MLLCPICTESCPTAKVLVAHWKVKHDSATRNSVLRCRQNNCGRSFNEIHSFKKHLIRAHSDNFIKESYPSIKTQNEISTNTKIEYKDNEIASSTKLINNKTENKLHANNIAIDSIQKCSVSANEFEKEVNFMTTSFAAKLYANPNLPRNIVPDIIRDVQSLLDLNQTIKHKYNFSECENDRTECIQMFEIFNNAFKYHETEYQSFQYFEELQCLIPPERVVLNSEIKYKLVKGKRHMRLEEHDLYIIPLKTLFTKFLSLPGVFDRILTYIKDVSQNSSITSVLQGEMWKKIQQKFENVVMPLILFFDEFEINNPLGTRRGIHKLGAVYCSIACIPPTHSSILDYIFLVQLHNVNDHKKLGNKIIFSNIIKQLIKLETEGINVNISGTIQKVNFALLSITGDNLGLNSILGFTTSFNSNHCCRVCTIDKKNLIRQVKEEKSLLRTIDCYTNNVNECSNGVIEECVFNEISNFHVLENIAFDPMHDLYEGICRYESAKILNCLIYKNRLFSLETLNNRIKFFDFGVGNNINIPPTITKENLKKNCIIYTASEMSCFIKYLGLIIGDLIPEENEVWQLYTLLREIICIIMTPSFTNETVNLLKAVLSEHHSLYLELFDEPLKPKHHYLLHYPHLMEKIGPVNDLSALRFEAKHKQFKNNAKVITSRKNPGYTLALKQQLLINYKFLRNEGFEDRFLLGKLQNSDGINKDAIFQCATLTDMDYKIYCWVSLNGILFKPKMVVKVKVDDFLSHFGQIEHIIISKTEPEKINFLLNDLFTLRFCSHVHAFEVIQCNKYYIVAHENLCSHTTFNLHTMSNNKLYVPCV